MIRGVGRGFISGWWGVALIACALVSVCNKDNGWDPQLPDFKQFRYTPLITVPQMTSAYQWLKDEKRPSIQQRVCFCCWCWGLYDRRQRRLSLAEHADSNLTLREDSPKFLKLLANKENVRRLSNINLDETQGLKSCVVEYSGSICPYPPADSNSWKQGNIPIPLYDDL